VFVVCLFSSLFVCLFSVVAGVELSQARAVVGMKLTVSAVVAQSVRLSPLHCFEFVLLLIVLLRPKKLSDAASFSKALVKLGKTDSLVHIRYDASSQQTVIAGAGELHLEVVLGDLRRLCKFELLVVNNCSLLSCSSVL
jgi:translation elongation factor EF-G